MNGNVVALLMPVALLTTGLSAGGLMVAMVGAAPMRLALPYGEAVHVHRLLLGKLDRVMPACLVVATLSTAVVGFFMPTVVSEVLCIIASSLALKAIIISAVKLVPINRFLARADLSAPAPQDDPRRRWRDWNAVRTWCVLAALLLDVVNVGLLL